MTRLLPSLKSSIEGRRFRYTLYVAVDKGDWLEQQARITEQHSTELLHSTQHNAR
jgi:hypothetical protein